MGRKSLHAGLPSAFPERKVNRLVGHTAGINLSALGNGIQEGADTLSRSSIHACTASNAPLMAYVVRSFRPFPPQTVMAPVSVSTSAISKATASALRNPHANRRARIAASRLATLCRGRLPEAFIFSGKRGAPYRSVYLTQLWRIAAQKAEIPVPLYVGTRHSFATRRWEEIQRAGADKLANEMGHGSAETTFAHYVRTVPKLSAKENKPS